ncbi:Protein of unknown function [Gryllus bimaculatus]|nr:Protein of unknown function [Gryllus bimaculatus]
MRRGRAVSGLKALERGGVHTSPVAGINRRQPLLSASGQEWAATKLRGCRAAKQPLQAGRPSTTEESQPAIEEHLRIPSKKPSSGPPPVPVVVVVVETFLEFLCHFGCQAKANATAPLPLLPLPNAGAPFHASSPASLRPPRLARPHPGPPLPALPRHAPAPPRHAPPRPATPRHAPHAPPRPATPRHRPARPATPRHAPPRPRHAPPRHRPAPPARPRKAQPRHATPPPPRPVVLTGVFPRPALQSVAVSLRHAPVTLVTPHFASPNLTDMSRQVPSFSFLPRLALPRLVPPPPQQPFCETPGAATPPPLPRRDCIHSRSLGREGERESSPRQQAKKRFCHPRHRTPWRQHPGSLLSSEAEHWSCKPGVDIDDSIHTWRYALPLHHYYKRAKQTLNISFRAEPFLSQASALRFGPGVSSSPSPTPQSPPPLASRRPHSPDTPNPAEPVTESKCGLSRYIRVFFIFKTSAV